MESRELLSFKILDATVDASVAGPTASARDPALTIGAAIQHMSIRDLQAEQHLTMVLQPNPPATSCSLALEFNQWADSSIKPSLVVELANAQFLLLFRSGLLVPICLCPCCCSYVSFPYQCCSSDCVSWSLSNLLFCLCPLASAMAALLLEPLCLA